MERARIKDAAKQLRRQIREQRAIEALQEAAVISAAQQGIILDEMGTPPDKVWDGA